MDSLILLYTEKTRIFPSYYKQNPFMIVHGLISIVVVVVVVIDFGRIAHCCFFRLKAKPEAINCLQQVNITFYRSDSEANKCYNNFNIFVIDIDIVIAIVIVIVIIITSETGKNNI